MQYTDNHEWVSVDGDIATVGISKGAQNELGEIVYVDLPAIGDNVTKGSEAAVLESTKAAVDIYSPVSGTVTEINEALKETPKLINSSPEDKGWLFKARTAK